MERKLSERETSSIYKEKRKLSKDYHCKYIFDSFAMIGFSNANLCEEDCLDAKDKGQVTGKRRFVATPLRKSETHEAAHHCEVISNEDSLNHVSLCKDFADCGRCTYLRNQETWKKETPIKYFTAASWLEQRMHDGVWGLGCMICAAAGCQSDFAMFNITAPHLARLKRHHISPQHQDALKQIGLDNVGSNKKLAPEQGEFSLVLEQRRGVTSLSLPVKEVGKRWKLTKMQWCLAEAGRSLTRGFLKEAGSIALAQDARKNKLLVRWSACSAKTLEHHKGFLCQEEILEGHFAANIVETLERMLSKFCTVGFGGPAPETMDAELLSHIMQHVEVLCADAASNEYAAGRLARKGNFSNIRHVSKDSAHASTRSPELKSCFEICDLSVLYFLG